MEVGRRRVRLILITVPWTCDAAVDDLALAEWPVLVLANIRDGGNLTLILENGHAFA